MLYTQQESTNLGILGEKKEEHIDFLEGHGFPSI